MTLKWRRVAPRCAPNRTGKAAAPSYSEASLAWLQRAPLGSFKDIKRSAEQLGTVTNDKFCHGPVHKLAIRKLWRGPLPL